MLALSARCSRWPIGCCSKFTPRRICAWRRLQLSVLGTSQVKRWLVGRVSRIAFQEEPNCEMHEYSFEPAGPQVKTTRNLTHTRRVLSQRESRLRPLLLYSQSEMPFIGRDWRSPGEAWVKTDEGSWEKLKILETSVFGRTQRQCVSEK